jgi:adenylate cyclase
MQVAPLPGDEAQRLHVLQQYGILDTPSTKAFDDLTALAAHICGTPISLVSLVDRDRQWFKSRVGLAATETPRSMSFCAHSILQPEKIFIVEDALADHRFADNPLVTASPNVRFYAGMPLTTGDGHALGTLCVIDHQPHHLTPQQIEALEAVSRQVLAQLELHRKMVQLEQVTLALHHSKQELEVQKQLSERLLHNVLPAPIAERLKQSSSILVDTFPDVTVLFADIVGFTELATHLSPFALVTLLNQIFSQFDELAEKYGLEKIKTIGDAYMAVGGLLCIQCDHVQAAADLAIAMRTTMESLELGLQHPLSLRVGIHTGDVIAGVIGTKKFSYDIWGDTVNIASRMESHGISGRIQVSEATYERLRDRYFFAQRGIVKIKGIGRMNTYFLVAKKPLSQSPPQTPLPMCRMG